MREVKASLLSGKLVEWTLNPGKIKELRDKPSGCVDRKLNR